MRRLTGQEKSPQSTRWLLLKNPWNLTGEQKRTPIYAGAWNTPIVRAYYLRILQLSGVPPAQASPRLLVQVMSSAMRSRLEPLRNLSECSAPIWMEFCLDQHGSPTEPWKNEQQIKSSVIVPLAFVAPVLHSGHLSLLCQTAATREC